MPMSNVATRERRVSLGTPFVVPASNNLGRGGRPLLTLVFLLLGMGCVEYSEGTLRYVDHPDLVPVELASSGGTPRNTGLGTVFASSSGTGTCDEVAAAALRDLLAEAKAIGAQAVEEVQFRGPRDWLGRVVCRGTTGEKTVSVRGIAVE
jgi:hypothetical protein